MQHHHGHTGVAPALIARSEEERIPDRGDRREQVVSDRCDFIDEYGLTSPLSRLRSVVRGMPVARAIEAIDWPLRTTRRRILPSMARDQRQSLIGRSPVPQSVSGRGDPLQRDRASDLPSVG